MAAPRRLSRSSRIALVLVTLVVLVATTTVGAVATAVVRGGVIDVAVESPDENISLMVPGFLVTGAVRLVPDRFFNEIGHEIAPFAPAIEAVAKSLNECPDAVFVEVIGPDHQVTVEKRGRHLHIDVEDGDAHVQVKVPLKAVLSLADRLTDAV